MESVSQHSLENMKENQSMFTSNQVTGDLTHTLDEEISLYSKYFPYGWCLLLPMVNFSFFFLLMLEHSTMTASYTLVPFIDFYSWKYPKLPYLMLIPPKWCSGWFSSKVVPADSSPLCAGVWEVCQLESLETFPKNLWFSPLKAFFCFN